MKTPLIKQKLHAGDPVYGLITTTADPQLAEWTGLAGFDYCILDGEHAAFNPADAVDFVRACELTGVSPLVRLGNTGSGPDLALLQQLLDSGFLGVMAPGLQTAEEVQRLVSAIKYPPLGRRGLGTVRANAYHLGDRSQPDYIRQANAETVVIGQFEDPALLDALPAMCAVDGLDAVMIGPCDLSLVMGYPDGPAHPEVDEMIDQAIARIRAAGKTAGITAGDRAGAERQLVRGATMILGLSMQMFVTGMREFLT